MPDDPCQALRARLAGPLPDALWALPADRLADLDDALTEAHARQAVALDRSIDQALRFIPWPLRIVVKKALLG